MANKNVDNKNPSPVFSFFVAAKPNNDANRTKLIDFIIKNSNATYDENNFDYLFIIGGDGAFLHAVYQYIIIPNRKATIITINSGHLGFYMQFKNNIDDWWKILARISSAKPHIFQFCAHQVEISSDSSVHIDYFINDALLFSADKAITPIILIKETTTKKSTFKLLLEQRVSGYLLATALGNFALMQSAGGVLFVQPSTSLTLKPLFPINNRAQQGFSNSLILNAKTEICITCEISLIPNLFPIEKRQTGTENRPILSGTLVLDGQRKYHQPRSIRVTTKKIKINMIKNSSTGFWWTAFQKII